jgi:hypothetical protein
MFSIESKYKNTNIVIEHDIKPTILIDRSFSTSSKFYRIIIDSDSDSESESNSDIINILDMERKIAYETLLNLGIKKAKIIFWDDKYDWIKINGVEKKKAVDIKYLLNDNTRPTGSTHLTQVLKKLKFSMDKNNDLYIFSDGEICDNPSELEEELEIDL